MTLSPLAGWWEGGEQAFGTAAGRLGDVDLLGPSLLPGWTRAHVLAHVAGNADALVNLLTWARTGVETPMYTSVKVRDTEITRRAALPPQGLRAEVRTTTERLAEGVRTLPAAAWTAEVRTAQGRTVPAQEVLWIRSREVWVHAVDLAAGLTFHDIPDEVLAALLDELFRSWERKGVLPDVTVTAGDRGWGRGALVVAGSLPAVTGWLTGRAAGEELSCAAPLPSPPTWL